MILYQLRCSNNHEFEAWFRDSVAYEAQVKAGDISCPVCSDVSVSKAIMAPNIASARSSVKSGKDKKKSEDGERELAETVFRSIEKLRSHVEANCDNVGAQFAEEARRIHYGEAEKRGIYGQATEKEATELNDEGIDFFQIPARLRRDS